MPLTYGKIVSFPMAISKKILFLPLQMLPYGMRHGRIVSSVIFSSSMTNLQDPLITSTPPSYISTSSFSMYQWQVYNRILYIVQKISTKLDIVWSNLVAGWLQVIDDRSSLDQNGSFIFPLRQKCVLNFQSVNNVRHFNLIISIFNHFSFVK